MTPAEARQWIDWAAYAIHGRQRYNPHDCHIITICDLLECASPDDAMKHAEYVRSMWRRSPVEYMREHGKRQRRVMVFARRLITGVLEGR